MNELHQHMARVGAAMLALTELYEKAQPDAFAWHMARKTAEHRLIKALTPSEHQYYDPTRDL